MKIGGEDERGRSYGTKRNLLKRGVGEGQSEFSLSRTGPLSFPKSDQFQLDVSQGLRSGGRDLGSLP